MDKRVEAAAAAYHVVLQDSERKPHIDDALRHLDALQKSLERVTAQIGGLKYHEFCTSKKDLRQLEHLLVGERHRIASSRTGLGGHTRSDVDRQYRALASFVVILNESLDKDKQIEFGLPRGEVSRLQQFLQLAGISISDEMVSKTLREGDHYL